MQLLKGLIRSQTTYSIVLAFLVIYVGMRACFVNITHDEAYSFHNVKNFWYAEFLCTGNSHWLNSLGIKAALLFGCENTLCIRWFSILSFFVTCCFAIWWIRSLTQPAFKWLAISLIFLNPYLLDYFGIARGYAGGMMFQCLTLLLFIKGSKTNRRPLLLASLVCAAFSALSNFSFVYFFWAFSLIYFFTVYFKTGKAFLKNKYFYPDAIFSLGIAFLIIRAFVFIVRCSNDVVGAGEPSFLSMFHVFSDGLLYYKIILPRLALYGFSFTFFTIISMAALFGIFKKQEHQNDLYFYISLLVSIMIATMVFNNLCFDLVYPFYRAALLLFIPVFMTLIFFVKYKFSGYRMTKPLTYGVCIVLVINFCWSVNFKFTFDFREQSDAGYCFDKVRSLNAKHVGISPELYGAFANYYQMTDHKKYDFIGEFIHTWMPKTVSPVKNLLADFDHIILCPPYNLSYYKNSRVHLTGIDLSPTTKNLILKIEKKP